MSLQPFTPPLRFSVLAFSPVEPYPPSNIGQECTKGVNCTGADLRETVYRGAYPKARNLAFLSRLRLRTILSLTPRPLENDVGVKAWAANNVNAKSQSVVLAHVRCEKPKDESGGLTREGAARAISIMLDRRNYPLYVHCLDGVEVTNSLIACMRRIQGWSSPAILSELGRALRDSSSSEWTQVPAHLAAFVTKFGQPDGLRLPPRNHLPSWLWPAPNPLCVLLDPFAWAGPGHTNTHSSAGDSTALHNSGEKFGLAMPMPTFKSSRRDLQLPIQHPSLKIYFDVDAELPQPPLALRPTTPLRPQHSRTSSTSTGGAQTPPHSLSRPVSRAGRYGTSSALSRPSSQPPTAEGLAKSLTTSGKDANPRDHCLDAKSSLASRHAVNCSSERQDSLSTLDGDLLSEFAPMSVASFLENQVCRSSDRPTPAASASTSPQDPTSPRKERAALDEDYEIDTPRALARHMGPDNVGRGDLVQSVVGHHGLAKHAFCEHRTSSDQLSESKCSEDVREDGEQTPTKSKFTGLRQPRSYRVINNSVLGSSPDRSSENEYSSLSVYEDKSEPSHSTSSRIIDEPFSYVTSVEKEKNDPANLLQEVWAVRSTHTEGESTTSKVALKDQEGPAHKSTEADDVFKEVTINLHDTTDELNKEGEEKQNEDDEATDEDNQDDEEDDEAEEDEEEDEEDGEGDLALEALDLEGY